MLSGYLGEVDPAKVQGVGTEVVPEAVALLAVVAITVGKIKTATRKRSRAFPSFIESRRELFRARAFFSTQNCGIFVDFFEISR